MTRISRTPLILGDTEAEVACALGGGAVVAASEPHGGPRKRPGMTIQRVAEALQETGGVKLQAAELLGVQRSVIAAMCQKHPQLEAVINDVTEAVIDLAEARLIENIRAGDLASIRYFLDNRGGARGYGRKVQLDGAATVVKIAGTDADL